MDDSEEVTKVFSHLPTCIDSRMDRDEFLLSVQYGGVRTVRWELGTSCFPVVEVDNLVLVSGPYNDHELDPGVFGSSRCSFKNCLMHTPVSELPQKLKCKRLVCHTRNSRLFDDVMKWAMVLSKISAESVYFNVIHGVSWRNELINALDSTVQNIRNESKLNTSETLLNTLRLSDISSDNMTSLVELIMSNTFKNLQKCAFDFERSFSVSSNQVLMAFFEAVVDNPVLLECTVCVSKPDVLDQFIHACDLVFEQRKEVNKVRECSMVFILKGFKFDTDGDALEFYKSVSKRCDIILDVIRTRSLCEEVLTESLDSIEELMLYSETSFYLLKNLKIAAIPASLIGFLVAQLLEVRLSLRVLYVQSEDMFNNWLTITFAAKRDLNHPIPQHFFLVSPPRVVETVKLFTFFETCRSVLEKIRSSMLDKLFYRCVVVFVYEPMHQKKHEQFLVASFPSGEFLIGEQLYECLSYFELGWMHEVFWLAWEYVITLKSVVK